MPTPEPPTTVLPPGADPAEEESPAAPSIPSFASLRAPRGRSAVDVLLPGPSPAPSRPASPARSAPSEPRPGAAAAPRPAEYADLLRFGMHVVRTVAGVPLRAAGWAVREPMSCLRRLLGA